MTEKELWNLEQTKKQLAEFGQACLRLADRLSDLGQPLKEDERLLIRLSNIAFINKASKDFISYYVRGEYGCCRDVLAEMESCLI